MLASIPTCPECTQLLLYVQHHSRLKVDESDTEKSNVTMERGRNNALAVPPHIPTESSDSRQMKSGLQKHQRFSEEYR